MKRFRWHRGSLADSLATAQPCVDLAELVDIIRVKLDRFGFEFEDEAVHVKPYGGIDKRCGWDTYLVTVDGYGVAGMTDGPP